MMRKLYARVLWHLKIATAYFNLPVRLVQWTGKSLHPVHPKHLLGDAAQEWYLHLLEPDDLVLDIGCANGMHTLACASRCRQVIGFDADHEHLRVAQAVARERGIANVKFQPGNAEEPFDFPDNTFDKVLFLDVLEHLHRRDFALTETHRVLKKRTGILFLAVPNRETSWKKLRREAGLFPFSDPDHKVEYSQAEIEADLARHGFACQQTLPIVFDTPWDWAIHLVGGVSLRHYRKLQNWRRAQAIRRPEESSGFRIVARALPHVEVER